MQSGEACGELQCAAVQADVVCIKACRHGTQVAVSADGQSTGVNLRAACVAVGRAQGQGASAILFDDAQT